MPVPPGIIDAAERVDRMARLIAGSDRFPAWLPIALDRAAHAVFAPRTPKPALRKQLEQEVDAVILILRNLDDVDVTRAVVAASPDHPDSDHPNRDDPDADGRLWNALNSRRRRLQAALADIPEGRGRAKEGLKKAEPRLS